MTMASMLRTVLLGGAVSVVPAVSGAQPLPPEQQPAGWVFTPAIRFGGGWDSNILLANAGDNPPGDYATPVNPSADLEYRGRRTRLSTSYEGGFLLYRTFDELNSSEQHARARLDYRVTPRFSIFGDGNFARVPTTDALELSGIPFYRVGSEMSAAGGGFDARFTRYLTLRSRYSLTRVAFDENSRTGFDLQGGHAHELLVGVDRALSPRLTIGAEYEARRAEISQAVDRFNSDTGSMVVQYAITPALTFSGLAGVSRLGAGLGREPKTGPAVRAALTHRAQHLVLSGVYSRSFIPSYGFGGTFQNEEWQGTVHVPFAAMRGYLQGSAARFDADPLEATQPSLRSVWLSGTLGYRMTRWLSCEGYYAQSQQDTQRAGGDLGRHQYGFRMRAAKPMRIAH